jgi:hypothetical protein
LCQAVNQMVQCASLIAPYTATEQHLNKRVAPARGRHFGRARRTRSR